jgi:GT2 family glycosyltransferase
MRAALLQPLTLALVFLGVFAATSDQDRSGARSRPSPAPAAQAQLPLAQVDVKPPVPSGRTIAVAGDGDLRAAIDAARPGDTITLEAGAVYRGPFTLPLKSGAAGGGTIVITTNAPGSLPPAGSRIDPGQADRLPTLVAAMPGPVLNIPPGVHGYRFVGLEIRPEAGQSLKNLVTIGGPSPDLGPPSGIVFDRCYLHGDPAQGTLRGIAMNGGATAVLDSYLSDFKDASDDSQAIAGWDGPGPFLILNNYLEAAGENVLFGGGDPSTASLVPSDIEIRLNHFAKRLSWKAGDPGYAGTPWAVKNLFELKNARRVLVDGNVFERNWRAAQNGFAILFTVRNQDGRSPWSAVEDVTFTNNIVRHAASGVNILGQDDIHPSGPTRRVLIRNNLFDDIGDGPAGHGALFQVLNGGSDVVFDHNTAAGQTESFLGGGDTTPHLRVVFRNNIVPHNLYGVVGGSAGSGVASLDRYFPDAVFRRNVIIGGAAHRYPLDNFFPPSAVNVGFVAWGSHDYRLAGGGPFLTVATDGGAPGVDFAALLAAQQGANSPAAPSPPRGSSGSVTRAVFWVSAPLLIYTYAGYPLLMVLWGWIRPRREPGPGIEPSVSILVIAHNEGDAIAAKIENLLTLDYPQERVEIVIASDGSTDHTEASARSIESPRVHVFAFTRRRGKAAVLNEMIPGLTGEIAVLADTRQRIDRGALRALVAPFADPRVGCVSGELMLNDDAAIATAGHGLYWRYEKLIRQGESALNSMLGATGAIYAIRRALFEPIPQDTILDDVLIPLRIAQRGYRVLFEPGARAFDRVATAEGEFARKVRTSAGNFQLLTRERWLLWPAHNRLWFQAVSHKGLRLLLPLMHAIALVASVYLATRTPFYLAIAGLQISFYALGIGGAVARRRASRIARILALPYVVCLLNWATVAGLIRFLRGLQPVTWEPTHLAPPAPRAVHQS